MKRTLIAITLALTVSALTSLAQDADGPPPPPEDGPRVPHVLPPHAAEKLKLTDDQKKQIAELDKDVKAKLENILTPEQFQELQQMRPPRPPGGMDAGGPPPDQGPENNAPQ